MSLDKLHKQLFGPKEEDGFRDEYVESVLVDVVRRDKDLNLIVYVLPGTHPMRVGPAIQKSCIDLFGHDRPKDVDLVYYPKGDIGLQAGGMDDQFDTFCVVIGHPRSTYYGLDTIKDNFTRRLYEHLRK